jgi:hypothetical protein
MLNFHLRSSGELAESQAMTSVDWTTKCETRSSMATVWALAVAQAPPVRRSTLGTAGTRRMHPWRYEPHER